MVDVLLDDRRLLPKHFKAHLKILDQLLDFPIRSMTLLRDPEHTSQPKADRNVSTLYLLAETADSVCMDPDLEAASLLKRLVRKVLK